ncbi:unnamed protein product [Mytilus edulis]|uniref:Uncharacterized protein n=1 Tax=Mytilus edulis TaxID=6550 RepID=A0A8S3T1W0_MYTED|nr:unnamed protein product [Mytilus edulis]
MRDKYHSLGMWAEYRFWRNRTKHIIDTSKQKYYNDMIKDSKDSKTLWKCIHSLNPSNPSKPHELITTGDHKTTDHKEIANTFNNYFTSCVEKLRHSRAPINSNFDTLTNYVQMKFLKKRHNKFIIPPVKVSELFAEITKLDVKTSSGTDNIGPKILKLSAPFIASSLTYIFNRMIDTGIYPSVLKNAKVAPIFKSDRQDPMKSQMAGQSGTPDIESALLKNKNKSEIEQTSQLKDRQDPEKDQTVGQSVTPIIETALFKNKNKSEIEQTSQLKGSWFYKLVYNCDGNMVNIDSCESNRICSNNGKWLLDIISKGQNEISRYMNSLLALQEKEFEILLMFSTLFKKNLIGPEDWLLPAVQHQHNMACYMILAYLTGTEKEKKKM